MSTLNSNLQLNSLRINGVGVIGEFELDGVTTVRVVLENANVNNVMVFRGRIVGQTGYTTLETFVGSFNNLVFTDTYDYLQIECTTFGSPGSAVLSAAGFTPQLSVVDVVNQLINDSTVSTFTTWSSSKINQSINDLGDRYVRTTRFETISSGTTGVVTIPLEQAVVLDDFGGTVDAVITTISGGRPTNYPAQTVSGAIVATTFDSLGNFTLTGTPSSYPVAVVYRVRQKLSTYVDTDSNLLGNAQYDEVRSVNNKTGDVVLTALDVGALDTVNALTVELEWDQLYPSFYTEPTYDINNRITQLDIWDGPAKTIALFQKTFTYNLSNQVTQVQITHIPDGQVLTKTFTYNGNGFIDTVTRVYTP